MALLRPVARLPRPLVREKPQPPAPAKEKCSHTGGAFRLAAAVAVADMARDRPAGTTAGITTGTTAGKTTGTTAGIIATSVCAFGFNMPAELSSWRSAGMCLFHT